MWATNVFDSSSRASRANAWSSCAASGCLATCGRPSGSNHPTPVPSGSRRLCSARLSGASSSQNVARTRWSPPLMPKSRHIDAELRSNLRQMRPYRRGELVRERWERTDGGVDLLGERPQLGRLRAADGVAHRVDERERAVEEVACCVAVHDVVVGGEQH